MAQRARHMGGQLSIEADSWKMRRSWKKQRRPIGNGAPPPRYTVVASSRPRKCAPRLGFVLLGHVEAFDRLPNSRTTAAGGGEFLQTLLSGQPVTSTRRLTAPTAARGTKLASVLGAMAVSATAGSATAMRQSQKVSGERAGDLD